MRLGDRTAWMMGRVTINPVPHIDPVGTIAVPAVLLLLSKLSGGGFFLFGWAKPVPVNFNNLRNPKLDMIWVAAAGPAANLVMAIAWGLLIKALHAFDEDLREGLGLTSLYNLSLGTVCDDHLYDRVTARDSGPHHQPWEK